jgi:DNA polymerase-3 subunit epsilon
MSLRAAAHAPQDPAPAGPPLRFTAIDFETADSGFDSACALGMVRVEGGRVTGRRLFMIRPPRREIVNSFIHGITWEDVRRMPTFGELWPAIRRELEGVDFLAAHNASFDRRVLVSCCLAAGVEPPAVEFRCTMQLARKFWNIRPTRLPDVCRHFGIPLTHHDAASDTEACAQIMMHAVRHPRFAALRPAEHQPTEKPQ